MHGLATSGLHNSAMITKAENLRLYDLPTECLSFYFYTYNQFKVYDISTQQRQSQCVGNINNASFAITFMGCMLCTSGRFTKHKGR